MWKYLEAVVLLLAALVIAVFSALDPARGSPVLFVLAVFATVMAWFKIREIYRGTTPPLASYYNQLAQDTLYHVVSVIRVPYSGDKPDVGGGVRLEFIIVLEQLGRATGRFLTIRVEVRPQYEYFYLYGNKIVPAPAGPELLPAT